jgi:hypothetical protein
MGVKHGRFWSLGVSEYFLIRTVQKILLQWTNHEEWDGQNIKQEGWNDKWAADVIRTPWRKRPIRKTSVALGE